jgi:hypothetical protein
MILIEVINLKLLPDSFGYGRVAGVIDLVVINEAYRIVNQILLSPDLREYFDPQQYFSAWNEEIQI